MEGIDRISLAPAVTIPSPRKPSPKAAPKAASKSPLIEALSGTVSGVDKGFEAYLATQGIEVSSDEEQEEETKPKEKKKADEWTPEMKAANKEKNLAEKAAKKVKSGDAPPPAEWDKATIKAVSKIVHQLACDVVAEATAKAQTHQHVE